MGYLGCKIVINLDCAGDNDAAELTCRVFFRMKMEHIEPAPYNNHTFSP